MIEALADVMLSRGVPEHLRSDNVPEFVAKEVRQWLGELGTGGRCTLSREVPGRTATTKASTENSGMSA